MLTVTLFEPQIPPNTGNIARLCGANRIKLDLVGNLGFDMEDKYLKRAGLDYWNHIDWEHFPNLDDYCKTTFKNNFHLLTTKSKKPYTDRTYKKNDFLYHIFFIDLVSRSEYKCLYVPLTTFFAVLNKTIYFIRIPLHSNKYLNRKIVVYYLFLVRAAITKSLLSPK